jgi:hypothetical protein
MRGSLKVALAVLAVALPATPCQAGPEDAVVRQKSHGASCTVIWTGPGKSFLLGCAHAYTDQQEKPSAEARSRPIVLDLPWPRGQVCQNPGAHARLVKIDYRLDLSLLELPDGPLPFVCPVALEGTRATECITAGYPEMRMPMSAIPADVVPCPFEGYPDAWAVTWTRQRPREGRSGGALIDRRTGCLVGVTQGYLTQAPYRGMYVSLSAVRKFLYGGDAPRAEQRPIVMEHRSPIAASPQGLPCGH